MNAWLFDVDGVITNLQTRKIEHPQILEKIVEKLEAGEPVGIITGRALSWLQERILILIEKQVKSLPALDNLCVEAEFGGISAIYRRGQKNESIEINLSLPPDVLSQIEKLISEEFSETMFADSNKQTHFTAEMREGASTDLFKQKQKELVKKLTEIVDQYGLGKEVEIHEDAIATNVKNKKLNKFLATNKFLEWLQAMRIEPANFICFGDSQSDLEIVEELHNQDKNFTFVYVGEREIKQTPFEVIRTTKHYDEGTLEYLLSN